MCNRKTSAKSKSVPWEDNKKYLNIAFAYAIAAMAGGVFYREFTKFNGFTGVTALGKVHTHLFLLGMLVFLVVALFASRQDLRQLKTFRAFLWTYNLGVPLTAVMLAVRGVAQVLGWTLSAAADASISGIAGIGHVLTGVGLVLLLVSLRKSAEARSGFYAARQGFDREGQREKSRCPS